MPNPKRRHSKTRTAKRRTHDALKAVPVGTCPQCQESKAPAPGVPALRLLQGTPGPSGRRGVSGHPTSASQSPHEWQLERPGSCRQPAHGLRSSRVSASGPRATGDPMRIAIDAMGGDHGPGSIIDGALVAARHLQIGLLLVGARDGDRGASSRAIPARRRSTSQIARHARVDRDGRAGGGGAAAQAPRVDPARGGSGAERPRRCAVQRRAHGRVGDGGARARSAGCRASTGRRSRRSSRPGGVRPSCSIAAPPSNAGRSTSCSSRSWVRRMRALALGCESPRVGLLSVGEEESKGNELTREAHRLLKSAPVRLHRQRRGPRRVRRRRRRHRLRRLHRQRDAEDQRRARRDRRSGCCTRSCRRRSARASATSCRARRSAGSGAASTPRSSAARRSSASTASASSGTAGRPPKLSGTPSHMAARFVEQRSRRELARACRAATQPGTGFDHDCVRVSGAGRPAGRDGAGAGRRDSESAATTFEEADAALGEPLSALCFEGPAIGCSLPRTRSRRSWP